MANYDATVSLDRAKFQVGESVEADFEQLTWTFRFGPSYRVSAGNFAIVPVEEFARMSRKLTEAEGLLRRARAGAVQMEHIEAFFDPEPLV